MEPFFCILQGCCYSIALLLDRQNSTTGVLLLVCHCYSIVGGGMACFYEAFGDFRAPARWEAVHGPLLEGWSTVGGPLLERWWPGGLISVVEGLIATEGRSLLYL